MPIAKIGPIIPTILAARIVQAMSEVGSVAKAGKNKDQNYAYQKAADIFEAAQAAFIKTGICLIATEHSIKWPDPLVTKSGATMFICRAKMRYTLCDVETGESISVKHTGVGYDTSDKALNKAKTMAEKYFLKQMLLIGEEEDDADKETIEPADEAPCPACGVVGAIIKGKAEYGGGWLCFGKKGGCGAKFQTDPREAKKEPEKRSKKPPKEESKPTAAREPEKPAEGDSVPSGTTPEETAVAQDDGDFDHEAADIKILIEQTKFPTGQPAGTPWSASAALNRILTAYNEGKPLEQMPQKIRAMLINTLNKRAAGLKDGSIKA